MGTAVVASGNGSPVLELGKQVPNLMAHLVKPLAVRDPLVAVPSGRNAGSDALLQQHGANLVAVVPFVSNQYARLWKIPQQEVGTGEVTALPFAEVKADRPSFPVAHHMQLAGQPPLVRPINRGSVPPF